MLGNLIAALADDALRVQPLAQPYQAGGLIRELAIELGDSVFHGRSVSQVFTTVKGYVPSRAIDMFPKTYIICLPMPNNSAEAYKEYEPEISSLIQHMAVTGITKLSEKAYAKSCVAPINLRKEVSPLLHRSHLIRAQAIFTILPPEDKPDPQIESHPHTTLHEMEIRQDIIRVNFFGHNLFKLPDWPRDQQLSITVKDSPPEEQSHFTNYSISTLGYATRNFNSHLITRARQVAIAGLVAQAVYQVHDIDLGIAEANTLYDRMALSYSDVPVPPGYEPCWAVLA